MAKAIEQTKSGLTVGRVRLGERRGVSGSVRQQVHDGDTMVVRTIGNFGVRFLGVDAPEISLPLPGEKAFRGLADPRWEAFLRNPFAPSLKAFDPPLRKDLSKYLKARVGPGTAMNHYRHASAAEDALEREVLKDMGELGGSEDDFAFFVAFAHEIMDRYGRLLGYINRDQPSESKPTPRPPSYNERLLKEARVVPYFIWPNINPFRRQRSLADAVIKPGAARKTADGESTLRQAREWVRAARKAKAGIFASGDRLRLEPFEVRFLARRAPPDRWVIDLGEDEDVLVQPQAYHTIPRSEDRLFIPSEYVPLFEAAGWSRQV